MRNKAPIAVKVLLSLGVSAVAAVLSLTNASAANPDIVIADFEGKDFGAWKTEGEAFGPGPAAGAFPGQKPVSGFNGNRFANSDFKGDKGMGRLQSPEFVIERSHIRFLIGGGARFPKETCMNLLVDGKPARTATGRFSGEGLTYAEWDVANLKGRAASIEIVDTATGKGGHIMVDDIVQTDSSLQYAAFEIPVTKNYLLLPIKNGGRKTAFQVLADGVKVRALDFALAIDTKPDWWAFDDVSAYRGKTLSVKAEDKLPEDLASRIPALFRLGDEPVASGDIYREALRPQFHFSPMRGWTNDPNGLAYFNGEYHLFYQANPFGLESWNKHWGHAVSPDLVHWTELPPAIRPLGGGAHSGGAFVDHGNKLGFGKGAEDTLFVSYTGAGERIAVGTGRALTLTDVPGNPVLKHVGRDPKIFRYEPQNKWVMVVYEEGHPTGYAFYDSRDLKSWRRMSCIEGGNECPEFFEMQVEGESVRKWVLYGCELREQTINGKTVTRGAKSAYMIGTFDGEKFTPETDFIRAHSGPAFYAAQTFTDAPNGRRIMIAWLEGAAFPGMPFSQAMTIPLDLKLRRTADGLRLCFAPVRELDQLHGASREGKDLSIAEANTLLASSSSELLDLHLDIETCNTGRFTLTVRGNVIAVDTTAMEISCAGRKAKLASANHSVSLRVLVDRGALELYSDDGRTGMAFGGDIYSGDKPPQLDAPPDTRVTALHVFEMKSAWRHQIAFTDSAVAAKAPEETPAAPKESPVTKNPQPAEGETLYNGIQLPSEWPSRDAVPKNRAVPSVPYLEHPPGVIPIDVGRQLFVDDFLIESTTLKREFHYPQRYEGNPILKPETPIELNGGRLPLAAMISDGFCFDPRDRLFKLWYHAGWRDGTMLATSRDGLHFERPNFDVTAGTNRVLPPREHLVRHGTGVCFDPYTTDAQQRFKMLLYEDGRRNTTAYTSPDGIHWAERGTLPEAGDNTTMFYNPFRKKWVISIRLYRGGRARNYREQSNFLSAIHWDKSESVPWAGTDVLDTPDPDILALMPKPEQIREEALKKGEDYAKLLTKTRADYGDPTQLYNLEAIPYESLMLGVFGIHRGPANKVCEDLKRPKICDLELAYSRDGFHWDRPDRTPFLASTRKEGDWERGYLHAGVGICTVMGDKLWFYYSGWSGVSPALGADMYAGGSTGVAFLRRDGFASMNAAAAPGLLTTRTLTFQGRYLFVNVNTPSGEFRAEILGEDGNAIAPYTMENSVPVRADATRQRMKWKDADDLRALVGKRVKVRFQLTNGELYAFWVSPDETGESHGYVGSGGPEFDGAMDVPRLGR